MNSLNEKSEIQFGCNQVIIVRNQKAKKKLPPLLSHALCLTVFESKGLEFDDVILFNFFTDSEVSREKWKILNFIKKIDSISPDNEDQESSERVEQLKCLTAFNQSTLALLCTELKNLYVSITRPKKNLIVFDENPEKRKFMQQYWQYMNVIKIVEKVENSQVDYKSIAQKTSSEMWKNQGERMMAHKFYDQAAKCFNISGDKLLENKAKGLAKASRAGRKLIYSEALLDSMNSSKSKVKLNIELKSKKSLAEKLFLEAAEELYEVYCVEKSKKLLKNVAQCYASGKDYYKAAELYKEIGFVGQAAECYHACKEFDIAGELFDMKNDYIRAIECFSLNQNWDRLIRCLYKHKNEIPTIERKKYVYKYIPVALEAVIPKVLPGEKN